MLNKVTCMHQNFPHMRFLSIITGPSSKHVINLRNLPPAHSRGAVTFSGLCDIELNLSGELHSERSRQRDNLP